MGTTHRRILALAVALAAASFAGCRRDESNVGVRDRAKSERAQKAAIATLGDESVVKALRTPDTLGRIIYDPPPDLSLASAQLRRPDIFKPPTPAPAAAPGSTPGAPGATPQRRDVTGGDATRDTSGGAARRTKQKP